MEVSSRLSLDSGTNGGNLRVAKQYLMLFNRTAGGFLCMLENLITTNYKPEETFMAATIEDSFLRGGNLNECE